MLVGRHIDTYVDIDTANDIDREIVMPSQKPPRRLVPSKIPQVAIPYGGGFRDLYRTWA